MFKGMVHFGWYIAGAHPENFSRGAGGGGGSEPPTLNFNKQKKSYGGKQVIFM